MGKRLCLAKCSVEYNSLGADDNNNSDKDGVVQPYCIRSTSQPSLDRTMSTYFYE